MFDDLIRPNTNTATPNPSDLTTEEWLENHMHSITIEGLYWESRLIYCPDTPFRVFTIP